MQQEKFKQIAIITITLILAFSTISLINYRTTTTSIHDELVYSSLPLLRENIYSEIEKGLLNPLNISGAMANDAFLKSWIMEGEVDSWEIKTYLQTLHDKYGFLSTFFVSDITSNYYHHEGTLKTISPEDDHDNWYYQFKESGKEYELNVDSNQASDNELTIFINYRVEDFDGNLLGVTGVGIRMHLFSQFLAERQEKYRRNIYLIDDKGIVQAHSDLILIENANIFDSPSLSQVAEKLLLSTNIPIDLTANYNHQKILITSRYIPEIQWFLVVEQNETDATKAARFNLIRTILVGIFTSLLISFIAAVIISHYQKRLIAQATTDALTRLINRHRFTELFDRAVSRVKRYKVSLSLMLIDVDNFKEINDNLGHIKGDQVLKSLANIIKESLRPDDVVARWGGDEFIILLENNINEAMILAERIRVLASSEEVKTELGLKKTASLSIGVTSYKVDDNLKSLIAKADKGMYNAKKAGKNRVSRE